MWAEHTQKLAKILTSFVRCSPCGAYVRGLINVWRQNSTQLSLTKFSLTSMSRQPTRSIIKLSGSAFLGTKNRNSTRRTSAEAHFTRTKRIPIKYSKSAHQVEAELRISFFTFGGTTRGHMWRSTRISNPVMISSAGIAKGCLKRPHVLCTPSLHRPFANSV